MATGLVIESQKRRLPIRGILLVVVIACAITTVLWYTYRWYTTGEELPLGIPVAKADPSIDESDVPEKVIDSHTVDPGHPRYITIPSIGVQKTRILSVGVTQHNLLDTPRNIHDAGWYTKSATPGQGYGAVLITAHNGGNTKDGVFANLSNLKNGDTIAVERGDGKQVHYRVTENQTVTLEEANESGMKRLMESPDSTKESISLITCAGKWIPRLGQFDHRVMVRAVIIDPSEQTKP